MNAPDLTSLKLADKGKKATTHQEIVKLFGVLILMTRFEFTARANLRKTTAPFKYIPTPALPWYTPIL